MEDAIVQVAIQVPALALVSFVFLRVLGVVLDVHGKKLDRISDAIEKLAQSIERAESARQSVRRRA